MNISVNVNECSSSPCVNGECNDAVNGYVCACNIDWIGTHCEGLLIVNVVALHPDTLLCIKPVLVQHSLLS